MSVRMYGKVDRNWCPSVRVQEWNISQKSDVVVKHFGEVLGLFWGEKEKRWKGSKTVQGGWYDKEGEDHNKEGEEEEKGEE